MTPGEVPVQNDLVPLVMLLASLTPAVLIFFLREEQVRLRTVLNLGGALAKVGLVIWLVPPVVGGTRLEWRSTLVPGIDLVLRAEPLSLFFAGLSAVLWLVTTVFAIGYFEQAPHRSRFFGFFSLCVTASTGIALSGNWVTFLIFYELLTLATYPLVAHRQTPEALAGARTYLAYTLTGGVVLLLGVAWLTSLVGPVEFTDGGVEEVARLAQEQPVVATLVFGTILTGLAVKAALVPLHGWLPKAMVAPAPVSALLHAVAVVKAGVFGIVRLVHHTYGPEVAQALGVLLPLMLLACVTIVYGSVRALRQDSIKGRLAYSTVSQVAYVTLGVSMVSVLATTGGVVHIVHQGLMKITLFFCAGLFAEVLSLHKVSELPGVGRRMPLTSAAFTVAALGMIGLPPMAGFVSKWQLGLGSIEAGQSWVVVVLVLSSLLNAAYFLPVVYALWLRTPEEGVQWHVEQRRERPAVEAPKALLLPAVVTAVLALAAGLLAAAPYAPLDMARFIAELSYG
ncbi:complex I subunit 5 family protein [Ornithinimicrobium sediminis]|uniref:complex I subunit 5 family protein n=1 Tax=Ornithinimicrobium sediminis TaxID=2904603 RepID=UPI001E2A6589|nr:monovalent cation/H+ antiporter subunit D family protein [Ornithinimicrobium sediminis]